MSDAGFSLETATRRTYIEYTQSSAPFPSVRLVNGDRGWKRKTHVPALGCDRDALSHALNGFAQRFGARGGEVHVDVCWGFLFAHREGSSSRS